MTGGFCDWTHAAGLLRGDREGREVGAGLEGDGGGVVAEQAERHEVPAPVSPQSW